MKKVALKYGFRSTVAIVVIFLILWLFLSDLDFGTQEVLGYVSMIVSLSFVYFGLKYYRDNENGNQLTFGQGLKLGLLIVLIPSIAFGLFDVVYTEVINPDFMEDYYSHTVENMKANLPASEFEVKLAEMETQKEMFGNPLFQFVVMGMTVFLVGFIMTVISSLILQRKGAQ